MPKIIAVSNFDDESVSDRLVAENIKSEMEARHMAGALNAVTGPNSADYFKVVPDDHKLYQWEP